LTSPTATHALARAAWVRGDAALGRTRALNRGDPAIETLIINVLLVLMAVTVVALARSRNLFGVVVLVASTASSWPPCWWRWTRWTWR
jgi:hypothetical protein